MTHREQACVQVRVSKEGAVSRRGFLRRLGAGTAGFAAINWLDFIGLHADELRKKRKSCVLLWMAGGPSQFETFDPKPGAETQGPTKAIPTTAPGIAIAEHWTKLAKMTNELAIIRSMTSTDGNHGRATYLLHTGYSPSGGIVHPGFGSVAANMLGREEFDLPQFVSIQGQSIGPSFLGVK